MPVQADQLRKARLEYLQLAFRLRIEGLPLDRTTVPGKPAQASATLACQTSGYVESVISYQDQRLTTL